MRIPQIIYISILMLALGLQIAKHGEPKDGEKYNAIAALIGATIQLGLLWWGGFFNG